MTNLVHPTIEPLNFTLSTESFRYSNLNNLSINPVDIMTGKRLTEYQKGHIDSLRIAGKNASDIAKIINKSTSCVSRYFRDVPAGGTRQERYSPGRPT